MQDLTGVEQIIQQTTGDVPRLLFVLSGPSGVGKNSIIRTLLANHRGEMDRVRTYTTRAKREDEIHGQQYYFVTPEEFRDLAIEGRLMEADKDSLGHDVYGLGKVYSMPMDIFEGIPSDIHLVLAEVDIHGMRRLKEQYPGAITIFITAAPADLVERIEGRVDDAMDAESLNQRIDTAREQVRAAAEFDYVVVNREGQLEDAIKGVESIIRAERMRVRPGVELESIIPDEAFSSALSSG